MNKVTRQSLSQLLNKSIEIKNNIKYHYLDRWNLKKARNEFKTYEAMDSLRLLHCPLISILLPTRNRWDILKERALPSVLNQTYKNWELIIIDDDSNPIYPIRTIEWMDKMKRITTYCLYPKVYHYPKTAFNRWAAGPVRALNYGLSKVKGDWIARLDDDDEWSPDMLEKMLRFAQQGNYEFVSANYQVTDIPKPYPLPYVYDNKAIIGGVQTWLYRSYLKCFRYNPDCWRKSWNKVNDVDLQVRMVKAGVKFGFLPEVVCTIRPRPGQTDIGLKAQLKEYENNVEG